MKVKIINTYKIKNKKKLKIHENWIILRKKYKWRGWKDI